MSVKSYAKKTTTFGVLLLFVLGILAPGLISAVHALANSSNVAYVYDFGTGVCDTSGPGSGSSVFYNAVGAAGLSGCPSGPITYKTGTNGFGTTASGVTVTFTNVPVSSITGVSSISGYDTVLLYEVCDIATHPTLTSAINTYLTNGDGKVIILDGDRCSPISAGSADYSWFLYPFTSSNPGPSGFSSTPITFVETEASPAVLSRAITTGLVTGTDAIGDSNTFLTHDPAWCVAEAGTNGLGVTGVQLGYVPGHTATNGSPLTAGSLIIWNGWDQWFTFGPNKPDAQVFDNMLDQPFNPDSLPCTFTVVHFNGPEFGASPMLAAGIAFLAVAFMARRFGKSLPVSRV